MMVAPERPVAPDGEVIRALVVDAARLHGVPVAEIMGHNKAPRVVRARQAVMAEAHLRGLSTPRIGAVLRRDHSTVLYGIRRALDRGDVVAG